MLFSEIYGSYFNVLAAVLAEAGKSGLTDGRLTEILREKAFGESGLSIPAALRSGEWPLLDEEGRPVIRHRPTMPLTTLQKRWLKALLLDPRVALFDPDPTGLEDVEPLFRPETFVYFDRYEDGDPFDDPDYIACFRAVLQAIREGRMMQVRFRGHRGARRSVLCRPCRLEYSSKDDKFRLLAVWKGNTYIINMGRIRSCRLADACETAGSPRLRERRRELTLLLRDERNALERVLLHFSHFEKETRKLGDRMYRIRLRYDREDETELLIRVLSFGPFLKVEEPDSFAALVKERIGRQLTMNEHSGEGI